MRDHIAYLQYVASHKMAVLRASRLVGVPILQALVHDVSKFFPSEWTPYVECFYAPDGSKRYNETPAFNHAWLRHQKRNLHHYQAWLLVMDEGGLTPLPMPMKYIREMIADWIGAGIAIHGRNEVARWYSKNWHKMNLHPDTRCIVEELLQEFGFNETMLVQPKEPSVENTDARIEAATPAVEPTKTCTDTAWATPEPAAPPWGGPLEQPHQSGDPSKTCETCGYERTESCAYAGWANPPGTCARWIAKPAAAEPGVALREALRGNGGGLAPSPFVESADCNGGCIEGLPEPSPGDGVGRPVLRREPAETHRMPVADCEPIADTIARQAEIRHAEDRCIRYLRSQSGDDVTAQDLLETLDALRDNFQNTTTKTSDPCETCEDDKPIACRGCGADDFRLPEKTPINACVDCIRFHSPTDHCVFGLDTSIGRAYCKQFEEKERES